MQAGARRRESFLVGKPRPEPPVSRPTSHGDQPVSRPENLPGLGGGGAMMTCENKTSEAVIQTIFDELPVP
jgi:hypothetical protein